MDKKRLFLLTLATLFVGAAFGVSWLRAKSAAKDEGIEVGGADVNESIDVPEIDGKALDALVKDGAPADRVVLEGAAIDRMLDEVSRLTPDHFVALGQGVLDATTAAEIGAAPPENRGTAFLARGWVDTLRTRRRGPARQEEHILRLLLEDDVAVYVLTTSVPEKLSVGSYVRADGLFLKLYSEESVEQAGEWIEGPLLVCPSIMRSRPAFEDTTSLQTTALLDVEDDTLFDGDGNPGTWSGIPLEASWYLMAYANGPSADAVNWKNAPELDRTQLLEIMDNGSEHRFEPFRIPISRIQGIRVKRAPENPARMETYTAGWIGNTTWKNVIHFQAPFEEREIRLRDYAYGNGFFLKNFAYPSAEHGMRIAPMFVMHSLEEHVPQNDPIFKVFGYAIGALTVVLMVLLVTLLFRDKRRSRDLQEELLRRRRARRQRDADGSASPG